MTTEDAKEVAEKILQQTSAIKKKTRGKFLSYISAALALVAGLAWNDAISTFIKYLFPLDSNTMIAKFVYAILLTIFISIAIVYLESLLGDEN